MFTLTFFVEKDIAIFEGANDILLIPDWLMMQRGTR